VVAGIRAFGGMSDSWKRGRQGRAAKLTLNFEPGAGHAGRFEWTGRLLTKMVEFGT